ncbi:DUF3467 domain-containing protein [Candidatus Dojkabacteria bacterium]|nr:DUF3467 domain-containing protein [Candidatus Dojkabacteria bacterium]
MEKTEKLEIPTENEVSEKPFASAEKIVPKFANRVLFSLNNDNVIITFVYKEGEQGFVIDRVVIDKEHASRVVDVLKNLINSDTKDEPDTK